MDDILEIAEMLLDNESTYTLGKRLQRLQNERLHAEMLNNPLNCACKEENKCYDPIPHMPQHAVD